MCVGVVMADNMEIKVAVLEEQIRGLREQHKAQNEAQAARLASIEADLKTLVAAFQKGKGAYAVAVIIAGLLGAAVAKLIGISFSAIIAK